MNHDEALACALAGVDDLSEVSPYDIEAAKDIWFSLATKFGVRCRFAATGEPEPAPTYRSPRRKLSSYQEKQVRRLHGQGMTPEKIAALFDVSQGTISRTVREEDEP